MLIDVGSPAPLGPSVVATGLNFAVFSSVAEAIDVCVFGPDGETRHRLPGQTGSIHHGLVRGLAPGTRYGYRVVGPWDPKGGHFCDHSKVVLDPFALGVELPGRWSAASLTGSPGDSARSGLRSVALTAPTPGSVRPRVPWADTVIYEAHVKGLTIQHPTMSNELRGTFGAVASDPMLQHLIQLGVTTVELLPVAAFGSEPFLAPEGLRQYWGYNPVSFFAPHAAYGSDGSPEAALIEFVGMVDRLHDRGLEVIVDVVLNHTAEGPVSGPHVSWRGLDNAAYYRRAGGGGYLNMTGTGNTFDLSNDAALDQAMAALRHWASLGVDGFRFDLAPVLGRTADGWWSSTAPFFRAIGSDPVLLDLKCIAEPWDLGPEGYRLGDFPDGWREWNDQFRDGARRFWRSEWEALGGFVQRMSGSRDIFPESERPFHSTINYITSHDGFTMRDLVSYEERHNEMNGGANHDGHRDNLSWNTGHEGHTDDPAIRDLRQRRARSMLATVLLADGVPMLLAGDELGRTQHGNNNAYCQDNEISWVDWPAQDLPLTEFTAAVTRLRTKREIRWGWHAPVFFDARGEPIPSASAGGNFLGILLGPPRRRTALFLLNGGHIPTRVRLPVPDAHGMWVRVLDTADPAAPQLSVRGGETAMSAGFSFQVFFRNDASPGVPPGP